MTSATADTNIYISAFEFGGTPRHFLDLARAGVFRLDISDSILKETLRVLRVKFGYSPDALRDIEEKIRSITHQVGATQPVDVIKADPSDNRVLECALTAKSDFIVSGDLRHVVSIGTYAGIPVVKVVDFLKALKRGNVS